MTGGYTGVYDAWDRLVEVKEGSTTVASYEYDGTSARIVKVTYSGGSPSETRHYHLSSAWRVLEERVGSSTSPDRQYLWGRRYVDELIFRDRDTDANGTLDERLYSLQDGNFNITAIADTSGAVVERFSYTPYGQRTVLTPNWQPTTTNFDWSLGHQGLVHDPDTGLIANRFRYLHPLLGRFVSRDPIGYLGGSMGLYEYVGSRPINSRDPLGLTIEGKDAFIEGLKNADPKIAKMLDALLEDPQFKAMWEGIDKDPNVILKVKSVPAWGAKDGIERFGVYEPDIDTLTINPTKEEHLKNPAELLDTLIHEMIHAVRDLLNPCSPDILPPDVTDWDHDKFNPRRLEMPPKRFVQNPVLRDYLDRHYGDSYSDPTRAWTDVNDKAQEMIVGIVRGAIDRSGVGERTGTFDKVEKRQSPTTRRSGD
jgi:RHS repeat-associated protein